MEGKYNDNELLFIREVLDQHGEYLADLFIASIEKKHLRVTDDLLNSIEYKVTNFGIDPVLTFSFFGYGCYKKGGRCRIVLSDCILLY